MEIIVLISCVIGFIFGGLTVFLASKKYLTYSQKIENKEPIAIPKRKKEEEPQSIASAIQEVLGYDGTAK